MNRTKILERYGERIYKDIHIHNQLCDIVSSITVSKGANNEIVKALDTWVKKRENIIVRTGGTL